MGNLAQQRAAVILAAANEGMNTACIVPRPVLTLIICMQRFLLLQLQPCILPCNRQRTLRASVSCVLFPHPSLRTSEFSGLCIFV